MGRLVNRVGCKFPRRALDRYLRDEAWRMVTRSYAWTVDYNLRPCDEGGLKSADDCKPGAA